ncbi:MAG: glycosyltransferase [Bacteroidetes bacterium]|nr:glycosyltransferase [Bacteroidota bacterium]
MKRNDIDIIILGATRWDFKLSSSTFSIAKTLAQKNRVFYIERPFSLKDVVTHWNKPQFNYRKKAVLFGKNIYKKIEFGRGSLTSVTSKFIFPINFLDSGILYDNLAKYNNKILSNTLKKIIDDNKIKNYIYLNSFYPYQLRKIPSHILQPLTSIYRSVDDISQENYIARHGVDAEKQSVKEFDIITASSSELCNKLSTYGKDIHLIPNAGEFELFHSALINDFEKPKEMLHLKGKTVIFIGNLNDLRADFNLLVTCVTHYPDVNFIIVGPYDKVDYKKFKLEQYKNLIFTKEKDFHELPHYLKHSNVAIIPFLKNKLTKSIYPLKVNEYLGAGMPVVSTNFSKDVESFNGLIYVANSDEEFVKLLGVALAELNENKLNERVQFAKENNWESRIEMIWNLIENYQENKFPV